MSKEYIKVNIENGRIIHEKRWTPAFIDVTKEDLVQLLEKVGAERSSASWIDNKTHFVFVDEPGEYLVIKLDEPLPTELSPELMDLLRDMGPSAKRTE